MRVRATEGGESMGRRRTNYGCLLVCLFLVGAYVVSYWLAAATVGPGAGVSYRTADVADAKQRDPESLGLAVDSGRPSAGGTSVGGLSIVYFMAIVGMSAVSGVGAASLVKWLRG